MPVATRSQTIPKGTRYTIPKKSAGTKSAAGTRQRFCSKEGKNVQGRKKGAQLHHCKSGGSWGRG